ncbi:rhomboid family intramembrane serine protease [Singulisphaera rosea]
MIPERARMMLRFLYVEFKDFPATMSLATAWVAVFLLMLSCRFNEPPLPSAGQVILGNFTAAHRFGDLTLDELFRGEVWRAMTCTFVHYNVMHIGLNVFGLYQLGCVIESWYGAGQTLAIYALIGGGGNLVSGLMRYLVGSNPASHAGGGSTIVLGLVALCAVVGWRSRTRMGDYLKSQMVGILIFTAVLGQILPIVDNWGHAGGAIVGALIGFAHRRLIRTAERPVGIWAGALGLLLMVASGAAQVRANRAEDRIFGERIALLTKQVNASDQLHLELIGVDRFFRQAQLHARFDPASFIPELIPASGSPTPLDRRSDSFLMRGVREPTLRAELKRQLNVLDRLEKDLATPSSSTDIQRLRGILSHAFDRPPSPVAQREFRTRWTSLSQQVRQKNNATRNERDALARVLRSQ